MFQKNRREGEKPQEQPTHEDGSRYSYRMLFEALKSVAFCDSVAELLDVLIHGYADMDETAQLSARIDYAMRVQVYLQAYINADVDPDEWNALSDDDKAMLNGDRAVAPAVDVWHCEVPLVLVDTAYAPITDVLRPISGMADVLDPPNLLWLRPREPWEFLLSLVRAGHITLEQALPD